MTTLLRTSTIAAVTFVSLIANIATPVLAQQDRYDALANSAMRENHPTPEASKLLKDELLFQRATQTYLWAMPLLNTLGMKNGSEKVFGAGYNILPVWKKRLDAKTLVTTPNSDVIYAMSYLTSDAMARWCSRRRPACKAFCSMSGSAPFPAPARTSRAMSVSSVRTKARAAST